MIPIQQILVRCTEEHYDSYSTNPRSLHRRAARVHPFFLSNNHVAHGVRHRSHFITARR